MNCGHCRYPQIVGLSFRHKKPTRRADRRVEERGDFCLFYFVMDAKSSQKIKDFPALFVLFSGMLSIIRTHCEVTDTQRFHLQCRIDSPDSCAMTLRWVHLTAQSKSTLAGLHLWIHQNDNAGIETYKARKKKTKTKGGEKKKWQCPYSPWSHQHIQGIMANIKSTDSS